MWDYENFALNPIGQMIALDNSFTRKWAVNYELVIKPDKNAIEEYLDLSIAPFMFQQIMNSPDDFDSAEFNNKKFHQETNGLKNAY